MPSHLGSPNTFPLEGLRTAILVNQSLNWTEYRNICTKNYTNLVTIYTKSELDKLSRHYQSKNFFIGLLKGNNAFKWSNGDSFIYDKTTSNDRNICIAMTASGSWEAVTCCEKRAFICYSDGRHVYLTLYTLFLSILFTIYAQDALLLSLSRTC